MYLDERISQSVMR